MSTKSADSVIVMSDYWPLLLMAGGKISVNDFKERLADESYAMGVSLLVSRGFDLTDINSILIGCDWLEDVKCSLAADEIRKTVLQYKRLIVNMKPTDIT